MTSDSDQCLHEWGDAELVELGVGEVWSPLCKHCGAVKLQLQERVAKLQHDAVASRAINRPQEWRPVPIGIIMDRNKRLARRGAGEGHQ